MAEVANQIVNAYNNFLTMLPDFLANFVNLFLLVLLIVIYSIFIWKFYRFIATKNLIGLNLSQYNRAEHPLFTKLFAGALYFIEYVIILPFLIFFWFAFFTIFLVILAEEGLGIDKIVLISATIIAAIRMTAYYKEDLAKDLAKLLPFTLLAFFILNISTFKADIIINRLILMPNYFSIIISYLTFIVILEVVLRFFDFIFSLLGLEDVEDMIEQEEK